MSAEASVRELKGVGEKNALLLKSLGITTLRELVEYYPRAYDVFDLPVEVKSIKEGTTTAVECLVSSRAKCIKAGSKTLVNVTVSDPTGQVELVWFNTPYVAKQLSPGARYIFRGRVVRKRGRLFLAQPVIYSHDQYRRKLSELQPVYRLTKGVTNNFLLKIMKEALALTSDEKDYLPAAVRSSLGLMRRSDALRHIHFPLSKDDCLEAHKRLSFDEFASFMALVRRMKEGRVTLTSSCRIDSFDICSGIIDELPYSLTSAQLRVFEEIKKDLGSDRVMSRMIQGDVGSGKTIIAVLAAAACAASGYQAAVMAPTDVLARQHYEDFTRLLEPFGIKVVLLNGQMTAAARKKVYAKISDHECDVVVGTHALIQDKVIYDRLGLAVIDEQHRFGVNQREAIFAKGEKPHILAMSATPIPRSLAIILFGDLDISIIDEMPKNRLPIKNCVVGTEYRPTAYKFISDQVREGHQAYIVCPMVEESELTEAENVTDYADMLRSAIPDEGIRIEILHGNMKPDIKNAVMESFVGGSIDILVSTTVIEVGVNVPNATVMMVENAERFGLAQLHQLRGRVGRGNAQSYCIFMKGAQSEEIDERLGILVKYNDGMKVAENDLRLRGPGDFFGTRQSGEMEFKTADIYGDADMLKAASDYVGSLSSEDLLCFSHTQTNSWTI